MTISKEHIKRTSSKSYKLGRIFGFGVSMTVFITIFYIIISFLMKAPAWLQYWQTLSLSLALYAAFLVKWGRSRWNL
jgi:hypothetical protein